MTRLLRILKKVNRLPRVITKRFKALYKKRRTLVIGISVLVVVAIGSTSYALFKTSQGNISSPVNNAASSEETPDTNGDTPILSGNDTEPTSKSGDKESDDDKAPTGAGCVGCDSPDAGFSINTASSIVVNADESAGPFTASSSDGRKVNWSGPEGGASGINGYTLVASSKPAPSFSYYVSAGKNVKPGSYKMTISALDSETEKRVTTSITIQVRTRSYFTISTPSETYSIDAGSKIKIPYTIHRYNDFNKSLTWRSDVMSGPDIYSVRSLLSYPEDNDIGEIVFNGTNGVEGTYTVKISAVDDYNTYSGSDTFQVVIK